jgi:hypothetical protein
MTFRDSKQRVGAMARRAIAKLPLAIFSGRSVKGALSVGIGLCAALLGSTGFADTPGHAVDSATHKPLAGAHIVLHCMGRPGLEGPTEIRRVIRITNEAGEYFFSAADRAGCSQTLISGELEGYHEVGATDSAHVAADAAAVISFMRNADWLTNLGPTALDAKLYGSSAPLTVYNLWFGPFSQAKKLAATPEEIAYVRGRYCGPIQSAYERMSDTEKTAITKIASSHRDQHGQFVNEKTTTYERDVQPYCDGQ